MSEETKSNWYALFVATGDEDNVKERLVYRFSHSNLKILVPKRRLRERKNGIWHTKIKPLFPGYLLLNGEIKREEYGLLRKVPGVIKLLGDKDKPTEIKGHEIEIIRKLTCGSEIIECSGIQSENQEVIVIDGPLVGLEGYIDSIDRRKGRAKVRLNLMGEPRIVELSITMVGAAS